jgi:hypothetical protein
VFQILDADMKLNEVGSETAHMCTLSLENAYKMWPEVRAKNKLEVGALNLRFQLNGFPAPLAW